MNASFILLMIRGICRNVHGDRIFLANCWLMVLLLLKERSRFNNVLKILLAQVRKSMPLCSEKTARLRWLPERG